MKMRRSVKGAPLDALLFYADASVFDHFPEAVEGGFRISKAVVPAFLGVAVVFRAGDEFLVFIFFKRRFPALVFQT